MSTPSSPRKILGSQENVTTAGATASIGAKAKESPPKPPRSAFMCYTDCKKKEIMALHGILEENDSILKLVAREWRKLSVRERYHWEEEARNDKVRFVREKADFKGVWVVPKRRAKKNPMAPKRPMSAFLKYSQTRRAKFKEENPDMGNTDVSRLLGETWRNASAAERAPYVDEELRERAVYKEQIKKFREKLAKDDAASRTSHHAVPQQFGDYNAPTPPPPPSTQQHQQMYENFGDMTVFEPLQVQSVEDTISKADQRVSGGYRPSPIESTRRFDHHHFRPYSEKETSKKDQRMFRPSMEVMPAEESMRQQSAAAYRGYSPAAYHHAYHPPYHAASGDRGRDYDYRDHPNSAQRQHPPSRSDEGSSRYAASVYFAENNTHPSFGFYHYP